MATSTELEATTIQIKIPPNVEFSLKDGVLSAKGPKGSVSKDFNKIPVSVSLDSEQVTVSVASKRKKEMSVVNTASSHVRNMVKGVTHGFTYRLKIVYSHFPITVRVKGDAVHIENFYGERSPRRAGIAGGCKVTVEGDDVIVKGVDRDAVGQTAANIELATRIRRKDPRVFLDGVYVYKKEVGM